MSKPAKKAVYRIRNWAQYNRALIERGSLTIWVDEAAIAAWAFAGSNQWGAQFKYSDAAVQYLLTLRAVFRTPCAPPRAWPNPSSPSWAWAWMSPTTAPSRAAPPWSPSPSPSNPMAHSTWSSTAPA